MDSKKYIYHITTTTGDARKSYRHEVDDKVVELLRMQFPELQQGELKPVIENKYIENKYALRLETHKRMYAVFTIVAVSDDEQREVLRFSVCSMGRGAFSAWEAVGGQDNPPPAPFCAVQLLPSCELADLLYLPLIADFERCLAWALLEHDFLKT